jgi:hypothetical protein
MTPTHDQFTLLYEDEHTKLLYEFKAVVADDVIAITLWISSRVVATWKAASLNA